MEMERMNWADVPSNFKERFAKLGMREQEVFVLVTQGISLKDIAKYLHISSNTVATHLSRATVKLGFKNRQQAIIAYIRNEAAGEVEYKSWGPQ